MPLSSSSVPSASSPRVYAVAGMTCQHCVRSLSEEILAVGGVAGVSVDLDAGALKVSGEHFSDAAVKAAVVEAGYEVIS